MLRSRSGKRFATVLFLMLLAFVISCISMADVLLPEASGTSVKKDGDMTIDASHLDQGYIMVKGKQTKKKLKVTVKSSNGEDTLKYDLNSDADYEVFPLQYGSGKYQVAMYIQANGNKYAQEGKVNLSVKLEDENICFLYPNQYVNYDDETPCVVTAGEICDGMTKQSEIYKTVCNYIKSHFAYDFVKSVSVKAGVLPDIEGCWTKHMGICQDLSAVTVAMLRSQGVPARLMIGTLGANTYHAWVTAVVDGEEKFFDPTAELNASSKTDTYTTERYY